MTTIFSNDGRESFVGPSFGMPASGNGNEYLEYVWLTNVIRKIRDGLPKTNSRMIGSIDATYLDERFLGKEHYWLIKEGNMGSGSPDFALVREHKVIIVDCFQVDASEPRNRNGKHNGTELQCLIGRKRSGEPKISSSELKCAVEESTLEFQTVWLACNLATKLSDKIERLGEYEKVVRAHILENGCAEDLDKDYEFWLLVEDISPCSELEWLAPQLAAFLEENTALEGLIVTHVRMPGVLSDSIYDTCIIRNDTSGREQLKNRRAL
ncbi:hypothetical protein [Adlercreutzia sp. ZJ138]|uniref:hypothetical protein n=1 Tax=Adlercreutzia sp. ZJ138 TaxID=2709405 RepID=UPI0013EA3BF4|nr:hypothetical protein [Adlercreutzia sp. ZJ138]